MKRRDAIKQVEWAMSLQAGADWEQNSAEIQSQLGKLRREGPAGADSPSRVGKFVKREMLRSRTAVTSAPGEVGLLGLERRFGPTLDYAYIPPPAAQPVGRSVARLVEVQDGGRSMSAFATGFMVSPRLLMTNHHVFEDPASADGTWAQFGYEYIGADLKAGALFRVRPDLYFYADRALDVALVAVDTNAQGGEALSLFNFVQLIGTEGKILVGHGVHMISYPEGMPKTFVFRNNPLVCVKEQTLQYLTDSDEGSSGSPAFNPMWELIALHHRSVPEVVNGQAVLKSGGYWRPGMSTDDVKWVANEGVRISVILDHLKALQRIKPHELLAELLGAAGDPVGTDSTNTPEGANRMSTLPTQGPGYAQMMFTGPVTINIVQTAPTPTQQGPAVDAATPHGLPGAEAVIRFDPDYQSRPGYLSTFLAGFDIPHPKATAARAGEMLADNAGRELVLAYHHYSLAMNKERRLQMWSAVNVDYTPTSRIWYPNRKSFGTDKWIPDPRIPTQYQLLDPEAYEPSRSLQRGHIVRRDDSAWGTSKKSQEYANSDTFHWTNCTPQHGGFNESSYDLPDGSSYEGIWGAVENKIALLAKKADGSKLIIFGGPVLDPYDDAYDWGYGPIQIPMKYWKIVLAVEAGVLGAYGFILDQTQAFNDLGFERLNFGRFSSYEKSINTISTLAGVDFDQQVLDADMNARPD